MLSNNFTIMRLVLACLVVCSHSYGVLGLPEPTFLGRSFGTFAVDSFFAISGYLVCGSFLATTPISFVIRRFMRIAPALLIFYQLSLIIWRYFDGYPQNPTPYIDGPVWTIVWEVVLYIILLFVGIAGLLNRFVVGSVYMSATVVAFVIFDPNAVSQTVVGQMFMLFLGGCLIRLVEDSIDMRLCGPVAIAVLAAFYIPPIAEQVANLKAYIPFVFGPVVPFEHLRWMVSVMCLPYALIWAARYSPLSFPIKSDYSYGMYVSAWPIQQVATHLAAVNSVVVPALGIFAISLTGSLLCAVASWHLLEKRAIRLSHLSAPK